MDEDIVVPIAFFITAIIISIGIPIVRALVRRWDRAGALPAAQPDTTARLERIEQAFAGEFHDLMARVTPLELGPPVGWPLKFRVSGPDPDRAREYARLFPAARQALPAPPVLVTVRS